MGTGLDVGIKSPFGSSRDPKRARAVRRAVHSVATRQWLENACGLRPRLRFKLGLIH